MDKPNVFKSNEFHLDESDVLHVIIKDVTGDGIIMALIDKETGLVEDSKIAVSESELYDLQDKDGNYYTVITIGTQEWIVQSLHTTTYADGTAIPNIENAALWAADTDGAYCWYDNDQATYEDTYGALYNFEAVSNEHGLVYFERGGERDNGWRMPTVTDWYALCSYITGVDYVPLNSAGGHLKETGTDNWAAPNLDATDTYGFIGRPSGQRLTSGTFANLNSFAYFQSSTEYGVVGSTNYRYFARLDTDTASLYIYFSSKPTGYAVRCMRDVTPTMRDFDGNAYTTVIIGTQEWTVENLQTTHYADGYPINAITDNATWEADTAGAYAWYSNDRATYGDTYGALYNWYAVNNSHELAYFQKDGVKEDRWRIPTKSDFEILFAYIGGDATAGDKLKEKGNTHWSAGTSETATDDFGFTMLPGGRRFYTGSTSWIGTHGFLWANTMVSGTNGYGIDFIYNESDADITSWVKNTGLSVRCVRDI